MTSPGKKEDEEVKKDPLNDTQMIEQTVVESAEELAKARQEADTKQKELKASIDTCVRKLRLKRKMKV